MRGVFFGAQRCSFFCTSSFMPQLAVLWKKLFLCIECSRLISRCWGSFWYLTCVNCITSKCEKNGSCIVFANRTVQFQYRHASYTHALSSKTLSNAGRHNLTIAPSVSYLAHHFPPILSHRLQYHIPDSLPTNSFLNDSNAPVCTEKTHQHGYRTVNNTHT